MNPAAQQPALRDIHLPDTLLWWPPAPGWWLLALLVIGIIAIIWFAKTRIRKAKFKNLALEELNNIEQAFQQHQDVQRLVSELSALLRRVSISIYPRIETAGIIGKQWLKFLDEQWPQHKNNHTFTDGAGLSLVSAPYQQNPTVDTTALLSLCRNWLTAIPANHSKGAKA